MQVRCLSYDFAKRLSIRVISWDDKKKRVTRNTAIATDSTFRNGVAAEK